MQSFLYWLPRILAIIFTLFISIFALDAFNEGYTIQENILAFLIHLIPTIVLILFTYISWIKPRIGGLIFIALGAAYTIMVWGKFPFLTIVIIAGPLYLTGLLFLIQPKKKKADTTVHIGGEKTDITQIS